MYFSKTIKNVLVHYGITILIHVMQHTVKYYITPIRMLASRDQSERRVYLMCYYNILLPIYSCTYMAIYYIYAAMISGVFGTGRVPGGVFADLRSNGVLNEDPLRRYNDVAYRWVSEDDWIYSTTFIGEG